MGAVQVELRPAIILQHGFQLLLSHGAGEPKRFDPCADINIHIGSSLCLLGKAIVSAPAGKSYDRDIERNLTVG